MKNRKFIQIGLLMIFACHIQLHANFVSDSTKHCNDDSICGMYINFQNIDYDFFALNNKCENETIGVLSIINLDKEGAFYEKRYSICGNGSFLLGDFSQTKGTYRIEGNRLYLSTDKEELKSKIGKFPCIQEDNAEYFIHDKNTISNNRDVKHKQGYYNYIKVPDYKIIEFK